MAKPTPSPFLSWFKAQYGKPPTRKTWGQLTAAVEDARYRLEAAEAALWEQEQYDARMDAALKAWQARESWTEEKKRG